ncbi:MAG: class I SAM-dependent methyltransferase [Alphaproteobacteria bacterium]|nr:class I SAM-dependent methyltransferase [Alphaproteobacteria bacterium]
MTRDQNRRRLATRNRKRKERAAQARNLRPFERTADSPEPSTLPAPSSVSQEKRAGAALAWKRRGVHLMTDVPDVIHADRVFIVVGMCRSGHHAVINWLLAHEDKPSIFLNNQLAWRNDRPRRDHVVLRNGASLTQPASLLVVNIEDVTPEAAALTINQRSVALRLPSDTPTRIIQVIRDPFNLFASRASKAQDGAPNFRSAPRARHLWLAHADEASGRTSHLGEDFVLIKYNDWLTDSVYRARVSQQLSFDHSTPLPMRVARFGDGSSFDGLSFDGRADEMDTLERWRSLIHHKSFLRQLRSPVLLQSARALGWNLPQDLALPTETKPPRPSSPKHMDPRDFLFSLLPTGGDVAEIGVFRGAFSRRILNDSRPRTLHLIDPWQFRSGVRYQGALYGGRAGSQEKMDRIFQEVSREFRVEIEAAQVHIIRSPSTAAASDFGADSLDWIYLDGDHTEAQVLEDLRHWSDRVKPGGHIVADDYDRTGWWNDGVTRAVKRFCTESAYELILVRHHQAILRRPNAPNAPLEAP